jgi:hypothetical protein
LAVNLRLTELMQRVVSEPERPLDPDRLARAARRRHRLRTAGPITVVVAAALAAPYVVAQVADRPPAVSDRHAAPHLSALDTRVHLGRTGMGAMDATPLVHPGEGSLVASRGPERIYLLEASGGQLCVLVVDERTGGAGHQCQPRSDLVTVGVTFTYRFAATGATTLVAVAPDGYTDAAAGDARARVTSNVAVMNLHAPQDVVTISGPGMPDITSELDAAAVSPAGRTETETNARAALTGLIRSAQVYRQRHGSPVGFAEETLVGAPALRRQMASLTDTTAVARIGPDRCLRADLSTGEIEEQRC